jgi:hypothetical protein
MIRLRRRITSGGWYSLLIAVVMYVTVISAVVAYFWICSLLMEWF